MFKETLLRLLAMTFLFRYSWSKFSVGLVRSASIRSSSAFISSEDTRCSDCLCQCLNSNGSSRCYGINCFPSSRACQHLRDPWIETDQIVSQPSSDVSFTTIDLKFCPCFPSELLRSEPGDTLVATAVSFSRVRFVFYHRYDRTLIVLGNQLISQYNSSTMVRLRSWTSVNTPLNVIAGSSSIFISFHNNVSVNRYDLQMNFLRTIQRPVRTRSEGHLYGLTKWNKTLFVADREMNILWMVNSSFNSMSIFRNFSADSFLIFNVIAAENRLYVSQLSTATMMIFDLIKMTKRTIVFDNPVPLYRMSIDPFCRRLWFGIDSSNYNAVPVFDLSTEQLQLYPVRSLWPRSDVHLIVFDDHSSFYTVKTDDNFFFKYSTLTHNCNQ